MSSTLATPSGYLSTVRLPGRRRGQDATPTRVIPPVAQNVNLSFLRRIQNWAMVDHRSLGYLDQVVVSPTAVLAVTTRYFGPAEGDEHVRRAWQSIRTANGAAKLLALTLGDDALEVRPVLVIWGPGAPELENGYLQVKGVTVVDHCRPELWTHLFDAPVTDDVAHRRLNRRLEQLLVPSNDAPIAVSE